MLVLIYTSFSYIKSAEVDKSKKLLAAVDGMNADGGFL